MDKSVCKKIKWRIYLTSGQIKSSLYYEGIEHTISDMAYLTSLFLQLL